MSWATKKSGVHQPTSATKMRVTLAMNQKKSPSMSEFHLSRMMRSFHVATYQPLVKLDVMEVS
jgi:hypothetical protein